jgi:hypothetical protein
MTLMMELVALLGVVVGGVAIVIFAAKDVVMHRDLFNMV